jgi:hypothetical protein
MIPCPDFIRLRDRRSGPKGLNSITASISKFAIILLFVTGFVFPSVSCGADDVKPIHWLTDYATAREMADRQDRMLLIFFRNSEHDALCKRFETETLGDPKIREKLQDYVCARVPLDAKIAIGDKEITLIEYPSFREMLGKPGIAIVDYKHNEPAYRGNVVSVFPLTEQLQYPPDKMAVILDLPRGTLTQRTLIYAVRTHPEKPPGADGGEPDGYLLEEARMQAEYQAQCGVQGHQHWESRFQRILGRLRGGAPREICAESWPGQNLVEAAVECVHDWRTSAGHWSALRSRNRFFGFDMKRGNNGIWYATGIVSSGGQDAGDRG